jgi:hypothetical protein
MTVFCENQSYLVEWQMHIDADNPATAARQAWEHLRREDSTANVFDVIDESGHKIRVDMTELEQWNEPAEPSKLLVIETFAMKTTGTGEATLAPDGETPDFWDVMVRYEGDDPIEEHENLSEHTVAPLVDGLQRKFPNATVADPVGG